MSPNVLRVGMVGYAFMGAVHAHAWRNAHRFFDLPITPDWPSNGQLGYKGETTLKEAFVSSRNAAAVRLTQELGVRRVAEVSRRLSVSTLSMNGQTQSEPRSSGKSDPSTWCVTDPDFSSTV